MFRALNAVRCSAQTFLVLVRECWGGSCVPDLGSMVFISRLCDNYTQWGGSGVGAREAEWAEREREATLARASGLGRRGL